MWLPAAAGGEEDITSAPPHTGDVKGGGKKLGITSVENTRAELWPERVRIHRGSAPSASHMEKQEREKQQDTIAIMIQSTGTHSARQREIRNYKPHFQLHRTTALREDQARGSTQLNC